MAPMLAQTTSSTTATVMVFLAILAVALLALALWTRWQMGALREALKGSTGESLETILRKHLETAKQLTVKADETSQRLAELEQHAIATRGSIGLVRFDAFPDVSGKNSFALAIQSEEGDGVVLTSITGREMTRIYCKEISRGKADQPLTHEEEASLKAARRYGGRTRLDE